MQIDLALLTKVAGMLGPAGAIVGAVVTAVQQIAMKPNRDPATPISAGEVIATIEHARGTSQEIRDLIAQERRKAMGTE